MKCPTDGQEMVATGVVGIDNSFRCKTCGGCFVDGWVVNSLAEGKELKISRYEIRDTKYEKGELLCPEDGAKLGKSGGEELPEGIELWKCDKCRKWWLPGNTVFDLAGAFIIRNDYLKIWRKRRDLTTFTLPAILTLVLVLGLGMILRQVTLRQRWLTQAAVVSSTNVRYLGNGRAEIKLVVNGDLGTVEYRPEGQKTWIPAAVVAQGDQQVAEIGGVYPGEKFLLKWNGGMVQKTVGDQE